MSSLGGSSGTTKQRPHSKSSTSTFIVPNRCVSFFSLSVVGKCVLCQCNNQVLGACCLNHHGFSLLACLPACFIIPYEDSDANDDTRQRKVHPSSGFALLLLLLLLLSSRLDVFVCSTPVTTVIIIVVVVVVVVVVGK